jgi:hypothetical protein
VAACRHSRVDTVSSRNRSHQLLTSYNWSTLFWSGTCASMLPNHCTPSKLHPAQLIGAAASRLACLHHTHMCPVHMLTGSQHQINRRRPTSKPQPMAIPENLNHAEQYDTLGPQAGPPMKCCPGYQQSVASHRAAAANRNTANSHHVAHAGTPVPGVACAQASSLSLV